MTRKPFDPGARQRRRPARHAIGARRWSASAAMLVGVLLCGTASAAPDATSWPIAGRQGIIQVVIVPESEARDRDAYLKQIDALCAPNQSCFINFFTNSTGAAVAVPLPDAIEHEPTAVFRRSTKQGGEFLRWSCRLKLEQSDCF